MSSYLDLLWRELEPQRKGLSRTELKSCHVASSCDSVNSPSLRTNGSSARYDEHKPTEPEQSRDVCMTTSLPIEHLISKRRRTDMKSVLCQFRDQLSRQDIIIKRLQDRVRTLERKLVYSEAQHLKARKKMHKVNKQLKLLNQAHKSTHRHTQCDLPESGCAASVDICKSRINADGNRTLSVETSSNEHCPGSSTSAQGCVSSSQVFSLPATPVLPQMLTPIMNSAGSSSCVLDGITASSASSDIDSNPDEGKYLTIIDTEDPSWNKVFVVNPVSDEASSHALPAHHATSPANKPCSVDELQSRTKEVSTESSVQSPVSKSPRALPLHAVKKGTKVLPSSEIDSSSLFTVNQVLRMFEGHNIAHVAGKLALMAVFGADVLKKCTPMGRGRLPALPQDELYYIKQVVLHNTPSIWSDTAAFEMMWNRECMKRIAMECSSARSR